MIEPLVKFLKKYPGGRTAFCKKVGCSEGRLSQILGGEKASPRLAIAMHQVSGGAVPGSLLRPDLWRSPKDVPIPVEKKTAAA